VQSGERERRERENRPHPPFAQWAIKKDVTKNIQWAIYSVGYIYRGGGSRKYSGLYRGM